MKYSKKLLIAILAIILCLGMIFTGCASDVAISEKNVKPAEASSTPSKASDVPVATVMQAAVPETQQVSYVTLDINPSIELTVTQGIVSAVRAFNDDGTDIILAGDVIGLIPHDAVDAIIGELAAQGYIDEEEDASLVITVSGSENDGLAESLKERANKRVSEMNLECEIISTTVSQEDIQQADERGMSVGRYLMYRYIAEDQDISFEQAAQKYGNAKMRELLDMADDLDDVFEDDEALETIIDGLTEAEQAILTAAVSAYKETVRSAQKAFIQAGKDAQKLFQDEKKKAQEEFQSDKDNDRWQRIKTQLKEQFSSAKEAARQTAFQAKAAATQAFLDAVSVLGLSGEVIDELLDYVFDFEWEDIDFDETPNDDDEEEHDEDIDDDDDDDEQDENDDEDDDEQDENDDEDDDDDDGDENGNGKDKEHPGKGRNNQDDDDDAEDDDEDDDDDEGNEDEDDEDEDDSDEDDDDEENDD